MVRGRTVLTLLATIALGILMTATGATAAPRGEHFNATFRFTESGIDNPCTPEFDDITLNITDRVQGFEWTENGTFFFDIHVSGRGEGVAADGTVYSGKINDKASGSDSEEGVDVQFRSVLRFISRGSAPNFFAQEWGHFTFPPEALTFERQRVECRG
jgi:hypothetical protein